ncbi:hypothetical protein K439DRAFT_1618824 [Ramaria rubella]|nr:hypothetical protein K439DRAFT_1618824 [Ramaria rubella]
MASLWQCQPQQQPLPLVQHAPMVHCRAPPPPPSLGQHPCCPNDGAVVESGDNTCGGCCHNGGNTTTPEVNTSGVVAPLLSLGQYHCPNDGAVLLSMVTWVLSQRWRHNRTGSIDFRCGCGTITVIGAVVCPNNGAIIAVLDGDTATPEVSASGVVVAPPVTTARLGPASN